MVRLKGVDGGKQLDLGPHVTIEGSILKVDLFACGTARDVLRAHAHLIDNRAELLDLLGALDALADPQGAW